MSLQVYRKTLKDAKEDKDNLIGYIENTENALKVRKYKRFFH